MVEIGTTIRTLREAKKMSQKQLAELLNVTPQAVSKWERNKSYPDLDTVVKLSQIFNVTTDRLLGTAKTSFFASLFAKKGANRMKKETNQANGNSGAEKVIMLFDLTVSLINDTGLLQTQLLATKMSKLLKENQLDVGVELHNSNQVAEFAPQADIILLTPTFGFAEQKLTEEYPAKIVLTISEKDYGLLAADKILQQVLPEFEKIS